MKESNIYIYIELQAYNRLAATLKMIYKYVMIFGLNELE